MGTATYKCESLQIRRLLVRYILYKLRLVNKNGKLKPFYKKQRSNKKNGRNNKQLINIKTTAFELAESETTLVLIKFSILDDNKASVYETVGIKTGHKNFTVKHP